MKVSIILLYALFILPAAAAAQSWPDRPVHIIASAAPGGGVDFLARLVAKSLTEQLKQSFVVENRGGAGGTLGANQVAKSAADGYTLLVCASAEVALSPYIEKVPYDPRRDLVPIVLLASAPTVVVVNNSVPVNNAKELIAYARSKGSLGYGTPGYGSNAHIAFALLSLEDKLPFFHVPYKGGGPLVADLLGNHIQVALVNTPPIIGAIRSGRVRPIAVLQDKRSPLLPDVPTFKEATGIDTRDASSWFAVMAPAATPSDIVARLQAAVLAMFTPALRDRLTKASLDVVALGHDQFKVRLQAERAANEAAIKRIGFKPP